MRQMLLTCQCRDRRLLRHITSDRASLWLERCRSSLFGIVAMAAFLGASVGEAGASGVTVLPNAVSYEYFGLNFAINIATSSSVGTLNYTGSPGCGGTCTATTSLGSDPSVSLNVNEITFQNTSGGFAEAELGYYVEYVNTPGTYTVVLHSGDTLSVPFSPSFPSAGQAYLGFGPAGSDTTSINNFNQIIFQDTDCVDGCRTGVGNFLSPMPLPTNQSVQMVANTPYFVQTWVTINPAPSGLQLSGMVDPTFTTNTGGTFIFSPGITGVGPSVPEPATWVTMLLGFAGLGFLGYRKAKGAVLSAS